MTEVKWLHLSDFHCGLEEQNTLWPSVQTAFFDDLARLYDKCGPWDFIVFTGDLVNKGSEFEKLNERLDRLYRKLRELGCKPVLFAVPGNHDLVRPDPKSSAVHGLETWMKDSYIKKIFWEDPDVDYRVVVDNAFTDYKHWISTHSFPKASQIKWGILPGDFAATFEKDGFKIGIVGLNTSFLQLTDGIYEERLAIDYSQLIAVCGDYPDEWIRHHHLCLLMTHHPREWLGEKEREIYDEITSGGRFAIHAFDEL